MRSPWSQISRFEADREYLVFASSIPPRSHRSTWRLFRGASVTKRQLASADGLVGFSLLARPLLKQYATLSVWCDEDALTAFAGAGPHAQLVSNLRGDMNGTRFVRWSITGADGRPTWREALSRLRDSHEPRVA